MAWTTKTVPTSEAGARFPELIADVATGVEITLTQDGAPVARMVPVERYRADTARAEAWQRYLDGLPLAPALGHGRFSRDDFYVG